MSTKLNLSPDCEMRPPQNWRGCRAPDFEHAASVRAAARRREALFWHDVRLALVGLFGAAVLLGGGFLALVVSR